MGRLSVCEIENLADRAIGRIKEGRLGVDAAIALRKLGEPKAMDISVDVMGFYFGGDLCEIGSSDFSIACHSVAKDLIGELKAVEAKA